MTDLFQFSVNPLELVVRGSMIYLGLVLVLRFVLRRDVGSMSVADVLFIVLVADASQNAMAGEYTSVADGAVLLGTLIAWNMALDWLSFRFTGFRHFIEPQPLPLIVNGKWQRQNMRKEWITAEEIDSKLREQGIEDIAEIRTACLEPSGELGVIKFERAGA